jgi:acetolactate synthase I/II/III large subunit
LTDGRSFTDITTAAPSPRGTLESALARELAAAGTSMMFGLVGEDTVAFVTEAANAGISYHGARHENVAVGMADGYAWRSGEIGVCTVTRGPGLMNAATAIRTAARAGRRVLIITGDVATDGDWQWDFKAVQHGPLIAALGAEYFTTSTSATALATFRAALWAARGGRTVVFSVPVDVLRGRITDVGSDPPAQVESPPSAPRAPSERAVMQAAQLLAAAERPLILAGRGARGDRLRAALEELAARTGALLGTTLLARELFRGSRYNLGVVGGFCGDPAISILAEVDCAIAFGASLNTWTTAGATLFKDVPVIQVDHDRDQLGANFPIRLAIHGDALLTADRLLELIGPPVGASTKPLHRPETLRELEQPLWSGQDQSTSDGLDPRMIASTIDNMLPERQAVVLDSGRHMTSPARFMHDLSPERFRLTASSGAIGMGLGVALGAAAARPEQPTLLFIGDGAMSMTLGDLETAVRHDLPIIIVVMNDSAYGSELVHLTQDDLPWEHALLPEVDFASVARSLGLAAAKITTSQELRAAIGDQRGRSAPLLLDCTIRLDIFVPRPRW